MGSLWVLCVMLALCGPVLGSQSTVDSILADTTVNIYLGVVKGIMEDTEPEIFNFLLIPPCVGDGEQVMEILDNVVTNLTHTNGLTNAQVGYALQTLVLVLQKSMFPSLLACDYNSTTVALLNTAIVSLNQPPVVNYTSFSLMVGNVEVYEEVASLLGEWELSNFHQAGYILGMIARKVSTNTTTGLMCSTPDNSDAQYARGYAKLLSVLTAAATSDPNERLIIPLNTIEEWDWCNGEYNTTEYICNDGVLGEGQFQYLNTLMTWQGRTYSWEYFDNQYYNYLITGPFMNETQDDMIKQLTIEMREYSHRSQQAQNQSLPAYQAYANSTKTPLEFGDWAKTICTLESCQLYTQDMNTIDVIFDKLNGIFNSTNSMILESAEATFMNRSNWCNYTEVLNGPQIQAPCWYTSMLPIEWSQNQEKGLYTGSLFMDYHDSETNKALCSGGLADVDPKLIQEMQDWNFLQIEHGGEWHEIEYNQYTFNFSISYHAKSVSRVDVTPGDWFQESVLWRFRNATGQVGGQGGDYYFNPETGAMNAIISGLLVANEVEYALNGTTSFGEALADVYSTNNITAMKMGPFFMDGISWAAGETTFSFTSYLNRTQGPYILGYIIKRLPFPPTTVQSEKKTVQKQDIHIV